MPILHFDAQGGLIRLPAFVLNEESRWIFMALDTGASRTAISYSLALELGFDPDLSPQRLELATAGGVVRVPVINLPRLRALGYEVENVAVLCLPLPPGTGVDGLLGSDFLSRFHLFINYRRSLLVVREARGFASRPRFWLEALRAL